MARPRKDQALDIPRRAVEETIRLLERHAVADLTMAQVAEAVGCSAPALYNHFRGKDDLLRAVHDEGFERLYAGKLEVATHAAGDGFARLREGGLAYLRFALANPALYRLMFAPPRGAGLEDNPFSGDVGRRCLHFLRDSVVACQAEGYLPGRAPDILAFTLWSMIHGAASLLIENRAPLDAGDPASATTTAAAAVDAVMELIAATRTSR